MTKTKSILAAAAVAVGMSVTAMPASANSYEVYHQTGSTFDSGGAFSQFVVKYVGKYWKTANVQLRGFDYKFTNGDHHIEHLKAQIVAKYYNPATGYVSFYVQGAYQDYNYDDDYYWNIRYTILMVD